MKNKILQEFLNSDIKIKSTEKLAEYIEFCIENNQQEKTKYKTEHHHILPEALFSLYKNIKTEFIWNGTHLLHKDHYVAHSILAEALDNHSMTSAWWGMNNLNQKSGKIEKPEEIIGQERFAILKEQACRNLSEMAKNRVYSNETKIKMSNSRKGFKPSKESTEKIRLALLDVPKTEEHKNNLSKAANKILDGGETVAENRNRKESHKRHKKIINDYGEETTLHKEYGKACSKTKSSVEWKETKGKESINKMLNTRNTKEWKDSVGINASNKQKKTKEEKGRWFELYHIDYGLIQERISHIKIKEFHGKMELKNYDNYLGKSIRALNMLKKNNSMHLYGLYIKEII